MILRVDRDGKSPFPQKRSALVIGHGIDTLHRFGPSGHGVIQPPDQLLIVLPFERADRLSRLLASGVGRQVHSS